MEGRSETGFPENEEKGSKVRFASHFGTISGNSLEANAIFWWNKWCQIADRKKGPQNENICQWTWTRAPGQPPLASKSCWVIEQETATKVTTIQKACWRPCSIPFPLQKSLLNSFKNTKRLFAGAAVPLHFHCKSLCSIVLSRTKRRWSDTPWAKARRIRFVLIHVRVFWHRLGPGWRPNTRIGGGGYEIVVQQPYGAHTWTIVR